MKWHFLLIICAFAADAAAAPFRAGAAAIDITPTQFPVIVNCGFEERTARRAVDPLFVKALVLDDGATRLAIVVVDNCVIPRALLDRAKELATERAGIPIERMLIAATHSHSTPSVLPALGARAEPAYTEFLPGKIAEAIIAAVQRLTPARVGWASVDDWEHTHCRRWIRRPDRMLVDAFGDRNVRANMHPGHQSPDVTGPSGPVDPGLSVLGVQSLDGRPLAMLANYSQHYYGSPLLSSDYYGRFAKHVAEQLGAGDGFVGMMSQGTSGDQQWMDYGARSVDIGYDAYAKEVAARALEAWKKIAWQEAAPLAMSERPTTIELRRPDEKRLAWAQEIAGKIGDRLPRNHAEIYARGTIYLHETKTPELRIQAVRIGGLGIAALPVEAFAITGLKIKAQSPLAATFNMTLANGVEGYIPPPEQHALGGYTTSPGGSNVLVTDGEPRIVEAALKCLEEVAKQPRRSLPESHGPAAKAVLEAKPAAYWRLDEVVIPTARDASGRGHDATFENGVALHLPGVGSGEKALTPSPFTGDRINRAPHFAGGRVRAKLPELGATYSVEFWLWNPLPADARAVTGYLFSRGPDADESCPGDHLGIGGTAGSPGKLIVFNGNTKNAGLGGRTALALKTWHHIVFVRDGVKVAIYLNGNPEPEIAGDLESTVPAKADECFIGGRSDNFANFEGKLDEVAIYDRALTAAEVTAHFQVSGVAPAP